MNEAMIEVDDVGKTFGDVVALDGVSLTVPRGAVLGLLGHNGAGRTTLVNVLTTMLPPTSGSARVAGFDVVAQSHEVRARQPQAGDLQRAAAIDHVAAVQPGVQRHRGRCSPASAS